MYKLVLVLFQDVNGPLILFLNDFRDLLVNGLGRELTVGFGEAIIGLSTGIVIRDVANLVIQSIDAYDGPRLSGDFLQVIQGSGRYFVKHDLLGCSPSQGRTHLIQHLIRFNDLSLLGQVPGSTQGTSPGHDGYLYQGSRMLQHPADRGVTRFVIGDGFLLLWGNDLILLLQTSNDPIHGIHKVLVVHFLLAFSSCDQSRFIANIGNVGS